MRALAQHMHWRQKAFIQKIVAALPEEFGDHLYYWMQRRWGALQKDTPAEGFSSAIKLSRLLKASGKDLRGEDILEVGTGRRLVWPIAFWVLGAERIVTVDLHRHLRPELVELDLRYIANNVSWFQELMSGAGADERRIHKFLALAGGDCATEDVMTTCRIAYHSKVDPGRTGFGASEFSLHISNHVLEHVPPNQLASFMQEGRRLIRDDGLLVHRIDHKDHFTRTAPTIPMMNFLRFSDPEWDRLAGNRFMYTNRLRVDDYQKLFDSLDFEIVALHRNVDEESFENIRNGSLPVHTRFSAKDPLDIATAESWFLLSKG